MALAKTPTESKNWLPLLLAAMVALAGLVLWDRHADQGTPGAGKPPREQVASRAIAGGQSINPLADLALDKLHDTIRRPLFEKSRRPVEAPATPPPPKAEPAIPAAPRAVDQNALSLLGVVASEGRTIALIKRNQSGQNVRVEVGDAVDGWIIESIEPQRVTLRQGDTQIALQLFRKKHSK